MKKILLFGSIAMLSITSFSCTTDENQENENAGKIQTNLTGPGDQPVIVLPPPRKAVSAQGPDDDPITVPPPPPKKLTVFADGPGDLPIKVPPPPLEN